MVETTGFLNYTDEDGWLVKLIQRIQWNTNGSTIDNLEGNVGIGVSNPLHKLRVNGNAVISGSIIGNLITLNTTSTIAGNILASNGIVSSGNIFATGDFYATLAYNAGFYSWDTDWGFKINTLPDNQIWTQCRGYFDDTNKGFNVFNMANNTSPLSVYSDGLTITIY